MGVEVGQNISHYKILRKLGHGGMGDVYLAENTRLGLKVALKFLASELTRDPSAIKRLEHEARAVAELSHPNISRIYDIEEADGHRFLVLEYLEGETLSDRIQRGPLPIEETIRVGKALAEGLVHAHSHGIVHRDMKASNVMMTSDGGVKIMDFGLARMADATRLTEPGTTLGTVSHMSPEQASGKEADERSDLWSLGVVLYQCLTGRLPFEGESAPVVLNRIGTAHPAPPTSLRTGVPMDLDRTILRCLEKDPALRYQHADDLLSELRRSESLGPLPSTDASTVAITPQSQKTPATSRRWSWLLITVVAIAAIAVWQAWERSRTGPVEGTDEPSAAFERPNWILVADFEGPPDDPNLAHVARELIVGNLERSKVVTPLTRQQLRRGLQLALRPDSTRITGEIARELAIRAAGQAYVEGRVDRIMAGFSIVVRAIDVATGAAVSSVSRVADNEETFISTLEEIGTELREKLGERSDLLTAQHPLMEAITPSFSAYRKYVEGQLVARKHGSSAARPYFKKALSLDPDFAAAWERLYVGYANTSQPDSARIAIRNALAKPERLTTAQLQSLKFAEAYSIRHDASEALRLAASFEMMNAKGVVLVGVGRVEEALEAYTQACLRSPFGPGLAAGSNRYKTLAMLGRYDEAHTFAIEVLGEASPLLSLMIPLAKCDWREAERSADAILNDASARAGHRGVAMLTVVSLHAVRGEVSRAQRLLDSLAVVESNASRVQALRFLQVHLGVVSETMLPIPTHPTRQDTTTSGLLLIGVAAAANGRLPVARECQRAVALKPSSEHRRFATDIRLLDAWMAAASSEWPGVINLLEGLPDPGQLPNFGRLPIRWLLAEAYSHAARRADARTAYEAVLSPLLLPDPVLGPEVLHFGIPFSFAHHRLVLLYSRMGRVEDARRHWEIFEKTFTNPDPELVPMVEEARQALEEAEAKAAS